VLQFEQKCVIFKLLPTDKKQFKFFYYVWLNLQEYCIASTQLEIVVVTATDGEKILKELDAFLFNTNCPEFNQVVV